MITGSVLLCLPSLAPLALDLCKTVPCVAGCGLDVETRHGAPRRQHSQAASVLALGAGAQKASAGPSSPSAVVMATHGSIVALQAPQVPVTAGPLLKLGALRVPP